MLPRTASRAAPLPDITLPGGFDASTGGGLGFELCCTGACRDTDAIVGGILTLLSSTLALGFVTVTTDMRALRVTKTVTVGDRVPVDDTDRGLEVDIEVSARIVDCLVGNTTVGTGSKGAKGVNGRLRILVGVKIRAGVKTRVGVTIRVGVGVRIMVNAGFGLFNERSCRGEILRLGGAALRLPRDNSTILNVEDRSRGWNGEKKDMQYNTQKMKMNNKK